MKNNDDCSFELMSLILLMLLGMIIVGIIINDNLEEQKRKEFVPDIRLINTLWEGKNEIEKTNNEFTSSNCLFTINGISVDSLVDLGEFKLTGYCDCPICQEEWVGTTALGIAPTVEHTIAVDPKVIPLGSHVIINRKEYVAEDVGGMIKENHIDIFMPDHQSCYDAECNGYAHVYLIKE